MYLIWLVLAALCLAYYLLCAFYAGFGSSFIFIWLAAAVGFGALFSARLLAVRGVLHFPKLLVRVLAGAAVLGIAVFVMLESMIVINMVQKPKEECSVIIVLGCQIRGEKITKSLRKRLDTAYSYAASRPDTMIIVSGGKGYGENISEAQAMYDYLCEKGIEPERIYMEDRSVNTAQNLRFSLAYIDKKDEAVGIVTSNFHIFRAKMIARANGLSNVYGIASPSDEILFVNYMVREAIGILKDFAVGNLF